MPAKKKSKTKSAKKTTGRAVKKAARKSAKRKPAHKKIASKPRVRHRKKRPSVSAETELKREFSSRNPKAGGAVPARQSEDFEGLSRAEQSDSESVDELVEEGNVFEAGAVAGVEEADSSDEQEVHTHEVPEDDVPEEYLDKD
jgi:hypothetical protein